MIVLAIDTSDARGDVTLLSDEAVACQKRHLAGEDYSSWLLPAVQEVLSNSDVAMKDVDVYGVAAGPGSFTGVRVGLTTVKGWAEVFQKPIVAVSRLEALALEAWGGAEYVGTWMDAKREQVFGALYKRVSEGLERIGDEMVIAPGKFVEAASASAGTERIAWSTTDPDCVTGTKEWAERKNLNEPVEVRDGYLGATIARMAAREFRKGRTIDALKLDANYVRRSDAEIFWKGMRRMAAEAGSASQRIRTFRPQDAPALTRILEDCPEAAQWTEQSHRELLESPVIVVFVSESGHDVSGFVVGRQIADEAEILNIAVTPAARQKGEGTALMQAAIGLFLSRGARRVFLEVRESNLKAIAFYERQGFSKVGRRAGYYRNPEGAAIVMEKKLTG